MLHANQSSLTISLLLFYVASRVSIGRATRWDADERRCGVEKLVVAQELTKTDSEVSLERIADEMLPQFAVLVQNYTPDPGP